MAKDYYWIVLMKILACLVSRGMIVIALFICLCLKDKLGICTTNCHIHTMTGNCSASLSVLPKSLRVASAMKGNPPLYTIAVMLNTF